MNATMKQWLLVSTKKITNFFCPDKGERVLQSSHREPASQSNDSKTRVSSGKGMSDDFQYNFLH